jgi:hypothetical protein
VIKAALSAPGRKEKPKPMSCGIALIDVYKKCAGVNSMLKSRADFEFERRQFGTTSRNSDSRPSR